MMLTHDECLAKAAELAARAEDCQTPDVRARTLQMAESWVDLARHAEWQDKVTRRFWGCELSDARDVLTRNQPPNSAAWVAALEALVRCIRR